MLKDLRHAVRDLPRHPWFTAVAVLTLAVGIGANTAIFSIVNGVLLRPLPYSESGRLVMIWGNFLKLNMERLPAKAGEYDDYSKQTAIFESVAAFERRNLTFTGKEQPERIRAALITLNLLSVLQVHPLVGRAFAKDDGEAGHDNVVILSHGFWQRHFTNATATDQTVTLDSRNYSVVGVLPEGFEFPNSRSQSTDSVDVLLPLVFSADQIAQRRGPYYLNVLARLRSDVNIEQARSQMGALAQRFEREQQGYRGANGEDGGWRISVIPLAEEIVGQSRRALLVLLGAVGLVLTIACANVGNLILLRAARRRKELAIRAALGASRWRIVRQLLIEALLVTLLGATAGLLLARWGIDLLQSLGSANLPRAHEITIDKTVLAFASFITIVSSAFLGLVPALQASKLDLQAGLRDSAGAGYGRRNQWSSRLVVAEVALSLLLLTGAGLLINSFLRLQRVHPAIAVEHLLTAEINLSGSRYRDREQTSAFYVELIQRLNSLPGVHAASFGTQQVLNSRTQNDPFSIEGRPLNPQDLTSASWQIIGPDYFRTLGLPLVAGRDIAAKDLDQAAPPVAVINERMAARYWPGESPIGRRLTLGLPRPENPWITIVGIAKDLPPRVDSTPESDWYISRAIGDAQLNRYVFVRSTGDPSSLANSFRSTVFAIDRNQPIISLRSMTEVVSETVAPRKFNTILLAGFAAIALGLAVLGIYSVISHAVAMRTREIGIRMALGAKEANVITLVLKEGMTPAMIGSLIGLLAALSLTRLMAGLLFEISATDPLTYVAVTFFLLSIALLACYIPARRATKVDPLVALRDE
jgi:putative ABC transport system permease protein